MNNKLTFLIGKYTLMLAISYALEFGVNHVLQMASVELYTYIAIWLRYVPIILSITLSVVMAIILSADISKMKVRAPYVILTTILFRPIGVVAFLIYVIISDQNESTQEPIEGILDR